MGLIGLISLVGLMSPKITRAIYDPLSVPNNKFGIHILETTEIEKAAELVNSSGGAWGYATIPVRANDRDLEKWTKFMEDCRKLKVIPILRIASFPAVPPSSNSGQASWMAPNEFDLVDFANFLDGLSWPIKNRYVVVYNEPNHEGEWGGFVDPAEYARVLDRAVDIFHKTNQDFFVISAGMDASAPNGAKSMRAFDYEWNMNQAWPGIFERVDGLSFHAYGNPGFSSYPNVNSRVNVASYRYEIGAMREMGVMENKPIFLTEAGWIGGGWIVTAFNEIWTDSNIVAITPFVLTAEDGPFAEFSFTRGNEFLPFAKEVITTPKIEGKPPINDWKKQGNQGSGKMNPSWNGSLPPTSKNGWLNFLAQKLLSMLMRK
jgi:hypothetical protein